MRNEQICKGSAPMHITGNQNFESVLLWCIQSFNPYWLKIWTRNLNRPIFKLKLWKITMACKHSNCYVAGQALGKIEYPS